MLHDVFSEAKKADGTLANLDGFIVVFKDSSYMTVKDEEAALLYGHTAQAIIDLSKFHIPLKTNL